MKKLLCSSCILFSLCSAAQASEGISSELVKLHSTTKPGINNNGEKPIVDVKRIRLKTGVELEYVEQGDARGVPVIFLHGITDSWHSFESTLPHLPSAIHAFALSQRGHGNSERPMDGYTPKDFAADVAAFIEEKNLGQAVIVGHSMGGVNAQQFALLYPSLTKAIVIIDSDPATKNNAGMPEFYEQVMKMDGVISKDFMYEFQKACLAKPIDSAYFNFLVNEGLKVPLPVFKSALKGLMEVDFSEGIKSIKQPALIFWGDKDAFFFRKGQETLKRSLRNSTLVIYEGVGHALHWEEPKRFANDLVEFIRINRFDLDKKQAR